MDPEMKRASGKNKLQVPETDNTVTAAAADVNKEMEEHEESEEVLPQNTLGNHVAQGIEKLAGTRSGQMLLKKADLVLKVIEDTAKWSLPLKPGENNPERPLPWVLFLILIVYLRVFRICYSAAAIFVGSQTMTAKSMVQLLQNKRRRLRAIRFQGLKTIRNREMDTCGANKGNSLVDNMGKLLNSAMCKPGHHYETPPTNHVLRQDGKCIDTTPANCRKRPRHEEPEDQDLTVCEMLEKWATENSDNDSDYLPPEIKDEADNSATSHNTTESAEEAEEEPADSKTDADNVNEENTNVEKVKENGETKQLSDTKPVEEIQTKSDNKAADIDNEQVHNMENEEMHTPEKMPQSNYPLDSGTPAEMLLAVTEAAPLQHENTPKTTLNFLFAPQLDESNKKSTPGHETAATLKPPQPTANAYETGSLQDFHNIFHPAPIVKGGSSGEAKTSTPNEAVSDESAASVSPENQTPNQKKHFYHSSNSRHNNNHYYSTKNRNKNRR